MSPEVGKIGKNSPTFIQPVSERSDGIKSFFNKQLPSPAKKVGGPPLPRDRSPRQPVKEEHEEKPIKEEAEGMKTEMPDGDEDKGLGDDSCAPNPEASQEEKPSSRDEVGVKRKRGTNVEAEQEEGEEGKKPEKRGGHQTKVIRRTVSDESSKAVSRMWLSMCLIGPHDVSATCNHELLQVAGEGKG